VVGGKTGTAETHDDQEHAWFIGTWQGLGFAILVEGGGAGSDVAAPIAGRLVSELVGLVDGGEDPLEPAEEIEEGAEAGGAGDEVEEEELDDPGDEDD
jgi:hypothetical protein